MALSHFFSASVYPRMTSGLALTFQSPSPQGSKGSFNHIRDNICYMWEKRCGTYSLKQHISCSMGMEAGQSGDPDRVNMDRLLHEARKLWNSSPQPVKSFPWNIALENFVQLVLDLIISIVKLLCVPLLGISCLSEMSYCAHEKKLFLIPFPLVVGIVVAIVLRETALEVSPRLKEAEVPWHLIAIAIFCTLVKLPGPYYPYWGRIMLPHFANGALWTTLWSMFCWYRRPKKAPGIASERSPVGSVVTETK